MNANNKVLVEGTVVREAEYSHTVKGEDFYRIEVSIARNSGFNDVLPVLISNRVVEPQDIKAGNVVSVSGEYRSFNLETKLILNIFANTLEIRELEENDNVNLIELEGFIVKAPVYRLTPNGREITDLSIACHRNYGRSDYIPAIAWGRNAKYASRFNVGEKVKIEGRIQSRTYTKRFDDGTSEDRVAYEVSINSIEECVAND